MVGDCSERVGSSGTPLSLEDGKRLKHFPSERTLWMESCLQYSPELCVTRVIACGPTTDRVLDMYLSFWTMSSITRVLVFDTMEGTRAYAASPMRPPG